LRRLLKGVGRRPYPLPYIYMHSQKFLEVFELSSLGEILLKAAHLLKVLEVTVY
jgi:chromosome segregation and condensation protein ScpB